MARHWFVLSALVASGARVLGSPARKLTNDTCNALLIEVLRPMAIENYKACVQANMSTANMSAIGTDLMVRTACWCANKVRDVVAQLKCCDDPEYSVMCQIQCNNTCTSQKALACIQDCPAICLDPVRASPGCNCLQNNCAEHLSCITTHLENKTQSGALAPTCDDYSLERTAEVATYYDCMQRNPLLTNWNKRNTLYFCLCNSSLKAAIQRSSCCGTTWGQPVCNLSCAVDCGSTIAAQCLQNCSDMCTTVKPNVLTKPCIDNCYDAASPCEQYKVCRPQQPLALNYICDDLTAPKQNGCCAASKSCPTFCGSRQTYSFGASMQCQCMGCPTTPQELEQASKEVVQQAIVQTGQVLLVNVARYAGLAVGPSSKLPDMVAQRNQEMIQVVKEHQGPYDLSLAQRLSNLNAKWNDLLLKEALLEKACQSNPANCPSPSKTTDKKGLSDGVVIAIICGVVLALALVLGILIMLYVLKVKRRRSNEPRGNIQPMPGDSNVVVGRPVGEMDGAGSAGASASGAPVALSQAGEGRAGARK